MRTVLYRSCVARFRRFVMTYTINETHDPNLRSWVESANDPNTDFPIQNLPIGLFKRERDESESPSVAIGDQILNVAAAFSEGVFKGDAKWAAEVLCYSIENLQRLGPQDWSALRRSLSELLRSDNARGDLSQFSDLLVPMSEAKLV